MSHQTGRCAAPATSPAPAGAVLASASLVSTAPQLLSTEQAFDEGIVASMAGPDGKLSDQVYAGYGGEWYAWDYQRPAAGQRLLLDHDSGAPKMNRRIVRLKDAASRAVVQVNNYQEAAVLQRPSVNNPWDPHKQGQHVRADGYAFKEWEWTPALPFMQADTKAWLDPAAQPPPSKSMRLLPAPGGDAFAIVFGALPHSFDPADHPAGATWHMELKIRDPHAAPYLRYYFMPSYAPGRVATVKFIREKALVVPDVQAAIDPADLQTGERRPRLSDGIDAYIGASCMPEGTCTQLSYNQDRLLQRATGSAQWSARQGGPLAVEISLPGGGYMRMPDDLAAAVEAAGPDGSVTIEVGNVMRDGGVCRWLIEYEGGGMRLLRSASFERYCRRA